MRCAVALCKTDNRCKGFTKGTRFFRFPVDLNVQKVWVNACKRLDKFNIKCARVCSKHFAEDSYEKNLKYELCDLYSSKNQRILKTNAIPSLNLPSTTHNPKANQRKERLTKINQSELVEEVLLDNTQNCPDSGDGHSSSMIVTNINIRNTDVLEVDSESSPQLTYREIGTQTDEDNRDKTILELKEEIERLKNENKKFETIFTSNQIKQIKNPEKRASWTIEDVERAIVIHSAGARTYRLLLKKGYPLPAESTLRAWCKKVKLEPGILKPVFNIIKKIELTHQQKLCVLSFDEIKVRNIYLYDKSADETLKPVNYAQVAIIRGLFGNWKQPIFYCFDRQMTKEMLFEIIKFAENAGFPIVAMVSDLGGGNRGLHHELKISTSKTWFINPANSNKIHVFADVPHLIKLLRNHYVDHGLIFNGVEINKNIIEKLLMFTNQTDLNIANKISLETLNLKGPERQKVKYATKLFSHTISRAISRCGMLGKFDSENWLECAEFFKDVNDWFDCLNTRVPQEDSRERKKAFGLSLDLQTSILDKMTSNITNLRVKGKSGLLPFQRGILITNSSLKLLFEDLYNKYKIKYILTYRLNQDILENFFGAIRSKGGLHDHPNPLEFKYRLRSYILGKNGGAFSAACNVQPDDTPDLDFKREILLTGQCLKKLTTSTETTYETDPLVAELDDISYDGLEHLAGYICHKLQKAEPAALGLNQTSFSWVDHLTEGGLKKPSEKLMADLQQLEKIFNNVNVNGLLIRKGYLSNLLTLASHVDCSDSIKTLFFRSRMFFRIRLINKELQDKLITRKRKMSKIIK